MLLHELQFPPADGAATQAQPLLSTAFVSTCRTLHEIPHLCYTSKSYPPSTSASLKTKETWSASHPGALYSTTADSTTRIQNHGSANPRIVLNYSQVNPTF